MIKLFNWIGRALSENGNPSSKRLFGFLFVLVVCVGTAFVIFYTQSFAKYLFYGLCAMIALLAGVATMPQLIQLWRGNPNPPNKTDDGAA
jgi:cobalamin biosynthesis protein CobD/CbiB